jgi:hypothetical protein
VNARRSRSKARQYNNYVNDGRCRKMDKFKWLSGKPMLPYVIPAFRWVGHPNSILMQDRYYKLGEITYEDVCAWRDEVTREGEEVDRLAPPEYWEAVFNKEKNNETV